MLIKNHTKWNTADLRKLFGRCIQEVRKVEDRGKNKGIVIELKNGNNYRYSSENAIGGRAHLGWYKMMIKIGVNVGFEIIDREPDKIEGDKMIYFFKKGNEKSGVHYSAPVNSKKLTERGKERKEMSFESRKRLAQVFIHEYYHNLGMRSQDRKNYRNDWTKRYDVSFVKDYTIGLEEVKPKAQRDLQMERYQKVMKYVKVYQNKAKRAQNLLKKWKQKQNRYEKILTAAGKIESEKNN